MKSSLKVLSWNCNGAFRRKTHLVDEHEPDLVVIQECEDPAQSTAKFRDWAGNYIWTGTSKNKGIAVFSRRQRTIEPLDWESDKLELFLPCRVEGLTLLGVWTKYANSPNFRYIGQLWKYMQLHREKIKSPGFLICGDFNSNKRWDEWDRWWNHSDVVRELAESDLLSTYHHYFKEPQGEESRPTLYHQRNENKPYHVDYIFGSKDLLNDYSLSVGESSAWLEHSDHMPLLLEIQR